MKKIQRCFGKKTTCCFVWIKVLDSQRRLLHGTNGTSHPVETRWDRSLCESPRCTPSSPSKPVRQDDFCNGLKSIKKRAAFAQWLVLFAFAAFKEMMFHFYKSFKFDQLSEISGFFAAWSKHQIVTSTLNWHICFRFPMMLKIQLHPAVTVGYLKNPAISADDRCFNALQRSLEQRPPRTAMRCGILKVCEIHIRQTFQKTPVFFFPQL